MPAVMRRRAVGSKPSLRSSGNSTMLLKGMSSITSSGLSACIWAGSTLKLKPSRLTSVVMSFACTIQVEAFWSNSDQKGVTSANTIRMRSTARTPSTAMSGWMPRARSICIAVPMPPKASSTTSAVHAPITMPQLGIMANEAIAPITPRTATVRPGRPAPGLCASRAVRATRMKECGSRGLGGTLTYFLRPLQNTRVAMAIRMPGMPKATAGP